MKQDKKKINFKKEAIYKIVVDGVLNEDYSNKFTGMQVRVQRDDKNGASTSLIGLIKDQSALSGILNNLYDLQYSVISVNMLSELNQE